MKDLRSSGLGERVRPDFDDRLVRIRPRDDLFYVAEGRTVLSTDRDGFFDGGRDRGLFVHETRMLSRLRYRVSGQDWTPIALSNVAQHSWLGYYACLAPGVVEGPLDRGSGQVRQMTEQTLELRLSRHVGGGLHEDVDLTNYSSRAVTFTLQLMLDADFADVAETAGDRRQRGHVERRWRVDGRSAELSFDYSAEHRREDAHGSHVARIARGLTVRFHRLLAPPVERDGIVCFEISLEPRVSWHACVDFVPHVEGAKFHPIHGCRAFRPSDGAFDRKRERFLEKSTRFATRESGTLAGVVGSALEQARRDLASLRLHDLDRSDGGWTVAAGLPLFVALFGRDTLTASWQAALLGPEMMQGTLQTLAALQGRTVDDWRDEQPGRMLHEAHTGPLASLEIDPRGRYYGSITTSGFFPVVLAELWHWTGDRELVAPLVDPALRALEWLDRFSDRDRDGFYYYRTRSEQGVVHQGWKDSRDAIVDEAGRPVEPPIATCEEQAFVHVAKLHLSEVLWWLDRKEEARRLYREAAELKKRFNEAFWMEEEGFFALGLDAARRPIRSIASNAGHALAAGIVADELAARTAERLLAEDLFSGWGVRTLSSRHPAYNPYSYHRGSVWPVENASFAVGFVRYGLHEAVERIARAQFEAAGRFEHCRLPEVFSGHARDEDHPFPALYLQTNSPQAWSSSAVLCLLQALVGLYPYAPLHLLLVDPHLPDWLPEITLENLRVGRGRLTIRFFRENGHSDYRVLEAHGPIRVVRQPSPWSLTATFAERTADLLKSFLPGR